MSNSENNGTKISLRDYIDLKFDTLKEESNKSEEKLDIRLNTMNEIREQLRDQASTFLPRTEYDARHELLDTKIANLASLVNRGVGIMIVLQVVIFIILGILQLVIKK